jgi:hypothetical protein
VPSASPLCFELAGGTTCPAGTTAFAAPYDDGDDQRACTACACDVTCSGGSVDVWDQSGCSGTKVDVSGACVVVLNVFDSGTAAVSGTPGAAALSGCDGGEPMGAVVPTGNPTMICCR